MSTAKSDYSRPVYFGIAIWGQEFCQKFLDHCLASLLASGNIPSLPNTNNKNKFLFCTTPADWEWFNSQPLFLMLKQYLTPEFMPIQKISEEDYQKTNPSLPYKFHIVTQAHSDLVDRMYQARSIGSLIFPDTMYSNNSLKSVFPHILKDNIKAILAHVPRLSTPILLTSLAEQGYIKNAKPVEISHRDLAHNALSHANTEVLAQNWTSLYAFDFITDIWHPLNNSIHDGIVAHSFAWCPIFLDYSKLKTHNIKCLENNTIDGSYLYNNFKISDIYTISDSDEFLMISYSPHTRLRVKEKLSHPNRHLEQLMKVSYWRKMVSLSMGGFVDPLKLELLKQPVFMHTKNLRSRDYKLRNYTKKIVKQVLQPPNLVERFSERLYNNKWIKSLTSSRKVDLNKETIADNLIKEHTI